MKSSIIPKIEIRDDGVWVHIGYHTPKQTFTVVTQEDYAKMREELILNERRRMIYLLEHLNEFADWVQYRGQDVMTAPLLDQNLPFAHESKLK